MAAHDKVDDINMCSTGGKPAPWLKLLPSSTTQKSAGRYLDGG
jgi:hypothetical protein